MINCLRQPGEAQVYSVPGVGGTWSLGPSTLGLSGSSTSWQEHEVEEVTGSDWRNVSLDDPNLLPLDPTLPPNGSTE